jgi:hypothetical protein
MKTWVPRFAIAALLLSVGYFSGRSSVGIVHAQSAASVVPRSYGKLVGALGQYAMFEDASGTVRMVDVQTGKVEGQITRN